MKSVGRQYSEDDSKVKRPKSLSAKASKVLVVVIICFSQLLNQAGLASALPLNTSLDSPLTSTTSLTS
ncbi:hypothetical protein BDV09DRAFT_180386 [Aspergillus tetrazonus]